MLHIIYYDIAVVCGLKLSCDTYHRLDHLPWHRFDVELYSSSPEKTYHCFVISQTYTIITCYYIDNYLLL